MTDVLRDRQRPTPPGPAAGSVTVLVHGSLAALAAALSGLAVLAAVVLVAWVADARSASSGADAVRAAADAWLLAHGGGLSMPGGRVAGVPLGLTLLAAVLLHRAGASLARAGEVSDLRAAGRATGALAVVYGVTAAVSPGSPPPGPCRLRPAGRHRRRAAGRPERRPRSGPRGRPCRRAGAALPGSPAGARQGGRRRRGRAVRRRAAARAGLPRRARRPDGRPRRRARPGPGRRRRAARRLRAAAAQCGAVGGGVRGRSGFAVGVGTGISPFSAVLGPVPALPLLAALPQDGTPPPAVRAVLLLPVLAGVAAGVVLVRSLPAEPSAGDGALHRWRGPPAGGWPPGSPPRRRSACSPRSPAAGSATATWPRSARRRGGCCSPSRWRSAPRPRSPPRCCRSGSRGAGRQRRPAEPAKASRPRRRG